VTVARAQSRDADKGGLDLVEQAAHLLRAASASTLATYYLGAIPFVLGFLYFSADMSSSPFANQHLAEAALAMTALFLWMKFFQTLFARRIRAQLAAEPMPRWSFRQGARILFTQAVIQPSGLFVIPVAIVLALPFAWVYAFYQNVTAMADADSSESFTLARRAWKQASTWAWQNHVGLFVVSVFGLCVFLNLAIVSFAAPGLLKMLFGIETIFSRSPVAMLNTTFFAAILGLTYLCIDPILKTVYALRCFYGESLQSGEDLKAELKRFGISRSSLTALLILSISLSCASIPASGQSTSPLEPAPASSVSPEELNRRIDEVIHESKYTWRMPREGVVEDSEKGIVTRFMESVAGFARTAVRSVVRWIAEWLRRLYRSAGGGQPGSAGLDRMTFLLYVLLAATISVLAVFLLRVWRKRNEPAAPVVAQEIHGVPDIADETIGADQLPEDGWTKLAREFLERGEFRLALRAFYLSSLAHLAHRNLIGIARYKSNRDYERELLRRGHAIADLLPIFRENVSIFERIWYGMHEVNRELVHQFATNVDKIKTAA
jgi:hypothetical protein